MMTARAKGESPVEVQASSMSSIYSTDEHSRRTSRANDSFYQMATKIGWLFWHS